MKLNSHLFPKISFITVFFFSLIYQNIYCQTERISKGNILEIRVYGHEELSRTVMVQPDGTVDFPLVSNIPIDGLSLTEFREVLTTQVAKYIGERPIITVRFSQTLNVSVTVLGQVVVPGEYMVAKNATVQGAITRAGGFTPSAQLDRIKLIRQKEGKKENFTVNLQQFYIEGDPDILPSLEEGDVIVVPGFPGSHGVKVIGAVKSPGNYTIFVGANLLDVLYMAGGPSEDADLNKTRLISPLSKESREIEINIKELLQLKKFTTIPEVKPGDVIYVPTKKSAWRGAVSFLRDVATIAWPIAMILYYSGVTRR